VRRLDLLHKLPTKTEHPEYGTQIWKPVYGYSQYYAVSDKGEVYSAYVGRAITPFLTNKPNTDHQYRRICLYRPTLKRKRKVYLISYLVMRNFVGPKPKDTEIDHDNGNTLDDRLTNLQYLTTEEHYAKHGRPLDEDILADW